jgi:leader peptidase (prepilin peptidase) / N-methyltransferase
MDLITVFELNPPFFFILVGIISLLVGSFLNVVIYRLPKMMEQEWRIECSQYLQISEPDVVREQFNLLLPRSACPRCGHKINALENIPVISYILLGGKCKDCKKPISWRYPLVEIVTCILSVIVAVYFGVTIQALFAIVLTWSLIVLTLIDYDQQILPDSITLPFLWLGIICNLFGIFTDINSSVLGAIFGYMIL